MRKMPTNRREQVVEALKECAALEDPLDHPHVKLLGGKWEGKMRLRVGVYRAIFHLIDLEDETGEEPPREVMEVVVVGPRGGAYD